MASAPEFVTADLRHLKAALVERAHRDGVSVSALVRGAVAVRLGLASEPERPLANALQAAQGTVRVSVRLSRAQADRFEANVAASGLSRGHYLAQLMASATQPPSAAERSALIAAIVASNEQVSVLNRNVRHLTELLSRGSGRAAQEHRAMLETLGADLRRHLSLVSRGLQTIAGAARSGQGGQREKEQR